jgi:hypothetical protein
VQRRHAGFVDGIWIGTSFDEAGDGRALCVRIPGARPRPADGRGVKWLGTSAIPGTDVSTHGYQLSRDVVSVGGRGNVQCCVTRIDVMPDCIEVVALGPSAGSKRAVANPGDAATSRKAAPASPSIIASTSDLSIESSVPESVIVFFRNKSNPAQWKAATGMRKTVRGGQGR